jgi:hypothetical protein
MYLIRSWIRWKAGNAQGAAEDLNKIWNRANPDNLNRYNSSNINHDAIFAEYLKEMTGENWTVDFMMGTRMDIPPADRKGVAPIKAPYSEWHWAIPVAEKELNPNYE